MRKFTLGLVALSLAFIAVIFVSCSPDVQSKPSYVYKSAPRPGVAAKVNGREISDEELVKDIQDELYEAENKIHEMKMEQLNQISLKEFINSDSRKTKEMSQDDFTQKFIVKGQKPDDKAVEAFIKERQIPAQHVNDQLKERIKQYLEIELKKKAEEAYIAERTAKSPTEIYLKAPVRPVHNIEIGKAPIKGSDSAKVTIIIFSEFQCPFCAQAAKNMQEVEKKFGDKVRFVFKHFPLSFHQHAQKAAEASMCAYDQSPEKFWKMHDALFADQSKLDEAGLNEKAKAIALDEAKFKECLTSGKFASAIEADLKQGSEVKINATPTIYINGQQVVGGQPLEVYTDIVEKELAK